MVKVEQLSVRYQMPNDNIKSLKEYALAKIKHKLSYKEFWALRNVNFQVDRGEVFGIVGNNGAGKSTLLKVVSGILKPTEGSVQTEGIVAPMLELGSGFDFDLTGKENIFLNGAILGYSKSFLEEKYNDIVEFSELGDFLDAPLRNYSSGMAMRLAFSVATVVRPDVLILDEILAVGDSSFQEKSRTRMMELMNGGAAVLIVSHNIDQIKRLCKRALWLDQGVVRMIGQAEEVCDAYKNKN